MAMPGRTYASTIGGYRYAHNGQEKDGEIFDGALSAEFWEYDSRLGRRWENDPLVYEGESSYACFSNNPIALNDPLGLADKSKDDKKKTGKGKESSSAKKERRRKQKEDNLNKNAKDGYYTVDQDGTAHYHKNEGAKNNPDAKTNPSNTPGSTPPPSGNNKNKNPDPKMDDHKVVGFHKTDKSYELIIDAIRNKKVNGRKDHFDFFTHGSAGKFQYLKKNGEKDVADNALAFDNMMKANSPDWKELRKTGQKITVTLYGCNMNSHRYLLHDGKRFMDTYTTIAQKISMIPNVTVIAANGYVTYGLTLGKPAIGNIINYRNDGKFSILKNGKEVSPIGTAKKINP